MTEKTLTVLTGRAGSGRSGWIFERIHRHALNNEPAILITEKQSSYEAEKALARQYGGLLGAEVLSLTRLSERLLEEQGEPSSYLSEQGRYMVIRKTAAKKKDELKLFAGLVGKRGFAEETDAVFSRLARNGVSPETLEKAAAAVSAGTLRDKLSDIAVLYRAYEEYLAGKYLTDFSLTERAIACLPSSELIRSHIYIDSADVSGRHAFRFISEALRYCRSLTVTVLMDPYYEDEELFLPGKSLRDSLKKLAESCGISYKEEKMTGRSADAAGPLRHLEGYLYRERFSAYEKEADGLSFTVCASPETEAELLGERILRLTREGCRYSDIAVTVTDSARYLPLLRRAFRRRGIPLFDDSPRPLSAQAAADLMLSAVRFCLREGMDDALHIVKSGLAGVTQDEAELFENYVLRYGLFGNAVLREFTFHGKKDEVPPEAEAARQKIAGPLASLKAALSREHGSARERVSAVFDYLTAMRVRDSLLKQAYALADAGEQQQARVLQEIWNSLTGVLGQIYRILGDDRVSLKELYQLLEEGVCSVTLAGLPGGQDKVSVGDVDRTRVPQRDCLFVLGANEGKFPPVRSDDELISDSELEELQSRGFPLWENTKDRMAADRLNVYALLSKARRGLYLSAASSDAGSELAVSPLLQQLKALFKGFAETSQPADPFPLYPDGAFSRTVEEYVKYQSGEKAADGLAERYAYFSRTEPYASEWKRIEAFRKMTAKKLLLGEEKAEKLFDLKRPVSASLLETYNKCPFEHYMKYGLRLEERKELREEASDTGTLYHDALEKFVGRVLSLEGGFDSVTEEDCDRIMDEVLEELAPEHHDGIYRTNPLMDAAFFLQKETLMRAARVIRSEFALGGFKTAETEFSFGFDDVPAPPMSLSPGGTVSMKGRIDRMDTAEDGKYVRIVDYKTTAAKKFSPAELLAGTTLQLPLYMGEALERHPGAVPAGMYYLPINQAPGKEKETGPNKLQGVTAQEPEVLAVTEKDIAGYSSLVAGLQIKKDGGMGANSVVCGADEIRDIVDFAIQKAQQTVAGIRSGDASVSPAEGACTWCKFGDICRFGADAGNSERKYKKKYKLCDLLNDIREGTVWDRN